MFISSLLGGSSAASRLTSALLSTECQEWWKGSETTLSSHDTRFIDFKFRYHLISLSQSCWHCKRCSTQPENTTVAFLPSFWNRQCQKTFLICISIRMPDFGVAQIQIGSISPPQNVLIFCLKPLQLEENHRCHVRRQAGGGMRIRWGEILLLMLTCHASRNHLAVKTFHTHCHVQRHRMDS